MTHLLCALIEQDTDTARHDKALSLMRRLGLPFGFVANNGPDAPTSMGAARRAGAIGVSGEFGGGATTTPASMAVTERAIDNLLLASGIIEAPVLSRGDGGGQTTRVLGLSRHSQAIFATRRGWFELAVSVGVEVTAGATAGWLHDLERLEAPEEELRFAEGGIVLSHRLHTMCESGDCLIQVAEPIEG